MAEYTNYNTLETYLKVLRDTTIPDEEEEISILDIINGFKNRYNEIKAEISTLLKIEESIRYEDFLVDAISVNFNKYVQGHNEFTVYFIYSIRNKRKYIKFEIDECGDLLVIDTDLGEYIGNVLLHFQEKIEEIHEFLKKNDYFLRYNKLYEYPDYSINISYGKGIQVHFKELLDINYWLKTNEYTISCKSLKICKTIGVPRRAKYFKYVFNEQILKNIFVSKDELSKSILEEINV